VAVPISEQLRSDLSSAVTALRTDPEVDGAWRWTDPAGWHLTLAFLGATDPGSVPGLAEALALAVRDVEPFARRSGGFGAFPSSRAARAVWYGVDDEDGRLHALARAVHAALDIQPGRFHAHLTLARARDRRGADGAMITGMDAPAGRIEVDRAILYRSLLGQGPARYAALAEALLGVARPVAAS
jgi:2'-5' RNA ligase